MKKINFTSGNIATVLTLAFVLLFSACSSDSDNSFNSGNEALNSTAKETQTQEQAAFSFVLKASAEGKDITTKGDVSTTTLFVFDDNNNFLQQLDVDKATILNRRKISITAPSANSITVIAWSGLTNNKEEVSTLNQNSTVSDLRIQLKNIEQVATSPGDLFYGQLKLNRANNEEVQTLNMERKVSALTLTTKNITKKFGNAEGDFYYKITTTHNTVDHNGKLTGSTAEYILPAYVDGNGNLTAGNITTLPSNGVTIELYRDDIMVLSSKKSQKTENLSLNAGEQLNITMDFYNTNFAVITAAYGVVLQVVNVG